MDEVGVDCPFGWPDGFERRLCVYTPHTIGGPGECAVGPCAPTACQSSSTVPRAPKSRGVDGLECCRDGPNRLWVQPEARTRLLLLATRLRSSFTLKYVQHIVQRRVHPVGDRKGSLTQLFHEA